MFRQKENTEIVVQREIRTRRHDAVIFETCRPNLEKYLKKKGAVYRGILDWNNLEADIRNIESYNEFNAVQKKLMYE